MARFISSGKGWQFVVQGEVPPGVDEAEFAEFLKSNISYTSALAELIRNARVQFGTVATSPPGPKIVP